MTKFEDKAMDEWDDVAEEWHNGKFTNKTTYISNYIENVLN